MIAANGCAQNPRTPYLDSLPTSGITNNSARIADAADRVLA